MSKKKPRRKQKQTEWAFEPTLNIKPQLTEREVLDVLAKLSQPPPKPCDPEKKGT